MKLVTLCAAASLLWATPALAQPDPGDGSPAPPQPLTPSVPAPSQPASAPPAPAPNPSPAPAPAPSPTTEAPPAPKPVPDAGAEPNEVAAEERAPSDEPTAADVEGSPRPGFGASGKLKKPEGPSGWLWVPRVLFFPVRGLMEVSSAPLRGLLWLNSKYALADRFTQIFFTGDKKFGIYPTALIETGFGLNVGARMVWKDMFGSNVDLRLRAGLGGRFQRIGEARLNFSNLLGDRFSLELSALFEGRARDRFFGIGNGDQVRISEVMPPIDPSIDDTAVETRFSEDLIVGAAEFSANIAGPLSVDLVGAYFSREYDEPGGTNRAAVDEVYDTSQITAFNEGFDYLYGEMTLTYDNRRAGAIYESDPAPSVGWYLSGYAGFAKGVGNSEDTDFVRYGADVQKFFRLAQNPRTLMFRLHTEGVTSSLDDVPFTDLPRLGGPLLLRGYIRDRFRDRIRALATSEYQWDLSTLLSGFVFVDAGQVFRRWDAFEFDDMRYSFGAGVQIHSTTSYVGRFHVATSIDGDVFAQFSFNPIFDVRSRTTRK